MDNANAAAPSAPPHAGRLSEHQLRHCSVAVNFFEKKLSSPQTIHNEFEEFLHDSHYDNSMTDSDRAKKCSIASVNSSKNRYPKAVPYDNNRIILNPHEGYTPSPTGYINASFVTNSQSVSRFIATQGPMPNTCEDFWEMIIQYRVPIIIMLTNLVDHDGTVKCGDYFQELEDGEPREFGNISIATKWTQTTDSAIILRCIEVTNKKSEEPPFSVLHILYPDWPDEGVPKDTGVVREIFRRVSAVPLDLGPIVVHCSAGIGRTGTYCVVHNTIQRVLAGDMTALDVANTVLEFRSQRVGLVQSEVQYVFCYEAIVDELKYLELNARANGD